MYSNTHIKVSSKLSEFYIPVYDDYGKSFNLCDRFNKSIHKKNFPFRVSGGRYGGPEASTMDYLFTCALVTAHHAYLYTKNQTPKDFSFSEFCEQLAMELFESSI